MIRAFGGNALGVFFRRLLMAGVVWCAAVLWPAVLWCTPALGEQRELAGAASEKVDAVVLLDASGSMRQTDPNRLRDEGARLFIQFLKSGDHLAIVEFSKEARVIRTLSEYSSDQSSSVGDEIARVGNAGTFTDLAAGIKSSIELLQSSGRPDAQHVIVMLSDGKMDPDPSLGSPATRTDALMNEILPDARAAGIKVHTIAFSDLADKDLLQQVAVGSDGMSFVAPGADDIHAAFAQMFLVVKKPQVLPLTSKGFRIDAAIDEATFYIAYDEGEGEVSIQAPSGKIFGPKTADPGVRWFRGQKFDVITVLQPEVGDWNVTGLPSSDSFATVLTNLKLVSDWPAAVYEASPVLLQARLYESEKPIELPEMTGAVRYAVRITPTDRVSEPVVKEFLVDDGHAGDEIAGDGIFTLSVTLDVPGEYKLVLIAKAPTFERTQQIPFRVRPRLVSLKVEKANATGGDHAAAGHSEEGHSVASKEEEPAHGDAHAPPEHSAHDEHAEPGKEAGAASETDLFVVTLSEESERLKNLEVKLLATDAERRRYELKLTPSHDGERRFEARARTLPHDGSYQVQALLTAEAKKKGHVSEASQLLRYEKISGGDAADVAVVVEEKKAEIEEKAPPLWIFILILTAEAGVCAGIALSMLKAIRAKAAQNIPVVAGAEEIVAALAHLEEVAARTEIPLSDPIFTDTSLELHVIGGGAAAALSVAAATAPEPSPAPAAVADAPPSPEDPAPESALSEGDPSEEQPADNETPPGGEP